jgi:hypothetical protein
MPRYQQQNQLATFGALGALKASTASTSDRVHGVPAV